MNTIPPKLKPWLAIALAAGALVSQAQASPLVYIDPVTQDTAVGGTAFVNIWVKDLADAVGAFSLTLNFSPSILSGLIYANDPDGKMGAAPLDLSGGFSAGALDLYFSADVGETEASLASAQGVAFRLARVSFEGLANGLSPLTLSGVVLSKWDGMSSLPGVASANGEACVGGNCSVPEPSTYALVLLALAASASARHRLRRPAEGTTA